MGSGCIAPPFLPSALDGGKRARFMSQLFRLWERATGTHWVRAWVGPRVGLDTVKRKTLPWLESKLCLEYS
jgi:hypothetical protein